MPKMSSEEIDEIVQKDLPNYHVAKETERGATPDSVSRPPVEASTPSIEELRRKYLPKEYVDREAAPEDSAPGSKPLGSDSLTQADDRPDDEIIAVTPNRSSDPWDRSARPKAAVISGADKKVIGQQG